MTNKRALFLMLAFSVIYHVVGGIGSMIGAAMVFNMTFGGM